MQARTKRILAVAVAAILLIAILSVVAMAIVRRAGAPPAPTTAVAAPAIRELATAHYRIESSADAAQTARTADAVEALYVAWHAFAIDDPAASLPSSAPSPPLQLRLYRDQAEFKAYNRSSPWAEAYYREPVCHAYYAGDGANPTHWMLHEAVHQLNREVGAIAAAKWQNEGLAAYFGASRLSDGVLHAGEIDVDAYPIWWLAQWPLSGDLEADIVAGQVIPLRDLLADTGPPIARNVNLYYLHWWSLTHFLLHHADGRHAAAYRRLLAGTGSLDEFEVAFGDVDALQAEWYDYARAVADSLRPVAGGT